jgi:thiol-disulfide isomerase/thioredoxin
MSRPLIPTWMVLVAAAAVICGCGRPAENEARSSSRPLEKVAAPKADKAANGGPAAAPEDPPDRASAAGGPQTASKPRPDNGDQPAAIVDTIPDFEPHVELVIPTVTLTDYFAATCRVKQGDRLPQWEALPDLNGRMHAFDDVRSERLTVVLFWSANRPFAVEALADLGPQVAGRYASDGVAVVAINPQDAPSAVEPIAKQIKGDFPLLVDEGGTYLSQIATGILPRLYLVDAQGKILWFDADYGRTTRRHLDQAIQAALQE